MPDQMHPKIATLKKKQIIRMDISAWRARSSLSKNHVLLNGLLCVPMTKKRLGIMKKTREAIIQATLFCNVRPC